MWDWASPTPALSLNGRETVNKKFSWRAGWGALACFAVATLGLTPTTMSVAAGGTRLSLHACTVAGLNAKCGSLKVAEDRVSATGRMINVGFVVIPASLRAGRLPDPVVYFAGGPGGSAIEDIPAQLQGLSDLALHHDLVFVDQRGTGKSNPLLCKPFPSGLADKAGLRKAVTSCLAKLQANVSFYTTAMAVDDVAQVLSALRYPKADLVGGSYGATAEQVFLLRHPEMVRTVTMLGGSLLSVPIFERFPANAQAAMGTIFARCERNATCHSAFPHLSTEFASVLASLAKAPWVVPAKVSPTKQTIHYTEEMAADALHQLLMSATTEAYVPVLIHTLATTKDHVAALLSTTNALAAAGAAPVASEQQTTVIPYPIRCNEAWARLGPSRLLGKASFEYASDLANANWWSYVCSVLPQAPEGSVYGTPKASNVPVLAFNGTADPQDPPANMAGAAQLWPNSRLLSMPGQSHQIDLSTWESCGAPITTSFVEQGSTRHLDTSCLVTTPPPPFAASLSALSGS